MNTHADKAQANKGQSVANELSQKKSGDGAASQFVDNRTAAIAQHQLAEAIHISPKQAVQRQQIKAMVGNTTQLQSMDGDELQMKTDSAGRQRMVQAEDVKPNNTGLPDKLKAGIENLSGYSMDDVRVHYNSLKPAQIQAHAYAQGADIHLASGQEKHLPHEAWHVVQQRQGRVRPTMQMAGVHVNDDEGLEREADLMGRRANVLQQKDKAGEDVPYSANRLASSPSVGKLAQTQSIADNGLEQPSIGTISSRVVTSIAGQAPVIQRVGVIAMTALYALAASLGLGAVFIATMIKTHGRTYTWIWLNAKYQRIDLDVEIPYLIEVWNTNPDLSVTELIMLSKEFGNKGRRPNFDPDTIGEDKGGIREITPENARPEDVPVDPMFRISFHQLHSAKLYLEQNHSNLVVGYEAASKLLKKPTLALHYADLSKRVKAAAVAHKKSVRQLNTNTPTDTLVEAYKNKTARLGKEAKEIAEEIVKYINDNKAPTDETKSLDDLHRAGTSIWRDKWKRTFLKVNAVLHKSWPKHKDTLNRWIAQKHTQSLVYMDNTQPMTLDYIGSLAKGYKGPPKQSVRFMPEKFDVDANLVSLPLATYALSNNAMVDRGQILSKNTGPGLKDQLSSMETAIQGDLVGAGLLAMGMDPAEPFEVVLQAEGVEKFSGAPLTAIDRAKLGAANREIRNRVFSLRRTNPRRFGDLGAELITKKFAFKSDDGWSLREDNEKTGQYAFTTEEVKVLNKLVDKHEKRG
jgi:hypothetical protein